MLIQGLLITGIFWLSHSLADPYANVKHVEIRGVSVKNKHCKYNGHNFTGDKDVNNSCEKLTCYPRSRTVWRMTCKEPPFGCNLTSTMGIIPECCEYTCPEIKHNCLGSDGVLIEDGKSRNLTNPCQLERCNKGTLEVMETCEKATSKGCTVSFIQGMKESPYPSCCGVRVCNKGRGRRKRRSETKKNKKAQ